MDFQDYGFKTFMDFEFFDYYINELLHKLSSENKSVIVLGF